MVSSGCQGLGLVPVLGQLQSTAPHTRASGAQQHEGYFLRVCCLRACSRWRVPVLDPAPMEKVGVDEPGSRKVAQTAGFGISAILTLGGTEGLASL